MTAVSPVRFAEGVEIGDGRPPVVIAGPCVMESPELIERTLVFLKETTARRGVPFVFKSSYDKANRTSAGSFRGPGLAQGLDWMRRLKAARGPFALLLDVHNPGEAARAAEVADVLQVPAFLCRQTDFLADVARAGRPVNVKKGQFVAPDDVPHIVAKVRGAGNPNVTVTERGASFGYHNLVVDMRSIPWIRSYGVPVIFDATHAVQLPGGEKGNSGGLRRFVRPLARAAAAAGCDGFFFEVHPDPDAALCDGPNMIDFPTFELVLDECLAISRAVPRATD